jgi:hypothetical protein
VADSRIPAEVQELLAAIRDALDCSGLDHAGMVRRTVTVQTYLGTVLSGARVDAKFPDLPPRWRERMTEAAELLRELDAAKAATS